MKKIAFMIEQLYGGGAERVTAALVNELCREYEVHLITTYCYDHTRDYPVDASIIRHDLNVTSRLRAGKLLKRIALLRQTIADIQPMCVVSLAGCGANSLLTVAMLGLRIPLILSERNDPARFPAARTGRMQRSVTYRLCRGLVFQTGQAQAYFP